MNHTN